MLLLRYGVPALLALLAAQVVASARVPIAGSRHDFQNQSYSHADANLVTYGGCTKCHQMHSQIVPYDRCSWCHAPHKAKRVRPLWSREDPTTAWVVWNGGAGQDLGPAAAGGYLSLPEFAGGGSGMCLSCHDSGVALATHDLSTSHPLAKIVPFGNPGWKADLAEGNAQAGSTVVLETRGSVGCTSCHSMHNSAAGDTKLRRDGELCLACHDR